MIHRTRHTPSPIQAAPNVLTAGHSVRVKSVVVAVWFGRRIPSQTQQRVQLEERNRYMNNNGNEEEELISNV